MKHTTTVFLNCVYVQCQAFPKTWAVQECQNYGFYGTTMSFKVIQSKMKGLDSFWLSCWTESVSSACPCHAWSVTTYEQKHPSALFLSAQAGEDLVPEQENEREEAEKRDASVLHSIPPVLMRDGAKRTGCHFKVKHKLCDNSGNNINNTCMCNILKHTLNNSFFFEFMMRISLWF